MQSDLLHDVVLHLQKRLGTLHSLASPCLGRFGYLGTGFGLVMLWVAWKIAHALFFSPLRNIPGPMSARLTSKRGLWSLITGQSMEIARSDHSQYGDVYVAKPNAVFLCDPEDVRSLLNIAEFRKTDMYEIFEYDGVPNVSTITDPAEANSRRRKLHPFFSHAYLAKMEPCVQQYGIAALMKRWDAKIAECEAKGEEAIVNYRLDTQLAMIDINGIMSFGREFHALRDNNRQTALWVNDTLAYMILQHHFPIVLRWPFSRLVKKLKTSYDDLVKFSNESIAIRREYLAQGGPKPVDMLQALLDSEDPESKAPMDARDIQADSISMLVGGPESTSSVLTWVIHFLFLYPEDMRKVVEEVRTRFPSDGVIAYADTRGELPYLEACIYETLRCIPTASTSFPRICHTRGVTIKGHYIPPSTEIVCNRLAAHHHEGVWKNPLDFNPGRFIDNDVAKRNMLSFSTGTRICAGKNLAWMLMVSVLANMYKNYDVSLPEDSLFGPENKDEHGRPKTMPNRLGVATMPANPERDCRMIMKRREL
ncbi:Pisatin demethylase-like protein [Hapsidospora chrysogenum ATCC 11550]|uniref:Pisatin demethylase-like protein n=1 Tax=Hapsidospora chrysogenum (strain ATCC 11550 / CBS 779.69 / DSM 880 / IAM 14645 / JCM 23072 / IMI 49137) TaxID=857340 RepID=A0A086STX3_HAPC1|nr:Pisatin demethylase-like protein [Hapsidospora chrysogenum ATCC 11550]